VQALARGNQALGIALLFGYTSAAIQHAHGQ